MKITKLGHSCVLVEAAGKIVLFDPGNWTDQVLIDAVDRVDQVAYTHAHPDHFSEDILRRLVTKFPSLKVVCNQEIADKIEQAGLGIEVSEESSNIKKFTSPHEKLPIPNVTAPAENGYHFAGVFSHPGDSQSFTETKKVLAMPFIGPWGKTGDSIDKVLELIPDYVLPIHDWHYTEDAKQWLQGLIEMALKGSDTKLLPNKNGRVIEIDD
ncbi:MBL fold metallo-hydrolase [Candidatus Saccharibacteria bacterium]|nr:MBL fold metallo-hydrolase [Candidatus Saccharibacteria bacterium]